MTRTALLTFAAGVVLAATPALAQQGGARAGVSWQGGGARMGGHMGGGNVVVRHGGQMRGGQMGGHRGNVVVRHHGGGNVVVRHNRGGNFRWHGGFRPGHNFQRRLNRGFFIHPFWFGPQFHINNWQSYGFTAPGEDQRWVRYYDDAYLVDRGGRVVDTRYGLDWDEYGERWEEQDGIPAYYGSREWQPTDEDYAWVDEHGGPDVDEQVAYAERGGHDGPPMPAPGFGHGGPGPMPHPGYGHGGGYGYGYGYGWAYPIVIETTVTTGGGYTEEIVEEVVETRRVAQRPRRARPACNCRAPARRVAPPAGELG